jgi:hypothetical protein
MIFLEENIIATALFILIVGEKAESNALYFTQGDKGKII